MQFPEPADLRPTINHQENLTLMENIRSYKELRVYKAAMDAAMKIFELSKRFPPEERYSLTDQMRRASRSVCSNLGERVAEAKVSGALHK